MESETFRSRILKLIQKSRKAIRLYTTMGRMQPDAAGEFGEAQVTEWRQINADLYKELSEALEQGNARRLSAEVFTLRDRYYASWRSGEGSMVSKQRELLRSAENGDFIRAALLSRELVSLKARVQAVQAAHHELDDVIRQSRLSEPELLPADPEPIELPEQAAMPQAKIIPIRKHL